jgi:hypothetical protein
LYLRQEIREAQEKLERSKQATALLTFLRRIEKEAVRTTLDPSEVKPYVEASERLRVAFRDVVEPGWRK